jgi:hypothetical protein
MDLVIPSAGRARLAAVFTTEAHILHYKLTMGMIPLFIRNRKEKSRLRGGDAALFLLLIQLRPAGLTSV